MNNRIRITATFLAFWAFSACAGVSRVPECQPGYAVTGAGTCEQDERCYDRPECKEKGDCTTYGDQCVAGSEADCRQSVHCRDFGECMLERQQGSTIGRCNASTDGCAASMACLDFGKCTLSGVKNMCIVDSDDDCAGSRVCREEKRCTATRIKTVTGNMSDLMSCQLSD